MTGASTRKILKQAELHCSERGSRLTEKRQQVLAGLVESGKAMSAYELTEFCRTKLGSDLLPMSVYRMLEFLEGEDLVHRLNLANKYVACSHIVCDHDHEVPQFLICKACQRVREVTIPGATVKSIARSIEAAGFQLASQQLELDCFCDDCAAGDPR